ncbi:MAG: hypothetical protein ACR2RF_26165 [Geminicoccaceae bacterium]
MATTDLTQPINRKEAVAIQSEATTLAEQLRSLIARAQGNGHDDAPDFFDEALESINNGADSITEELDSARSEAA